MELLLRNHGRAVDGTNSDEGTSSSSVASITSSVRDISLGFPYFDGHTPVLEWIFKAEKFFRYHHTPNKDRVEITTIHFEKDVISWFQMLQRMDSMHSWSDLTRALESQFGPSSFDCPMANRSNDLSNEAILNCFVSSLNHDIRRDVVAQSPTTLIRGVSLAKLYEEKYAPKVASRPNNYVHKYTLVHATASPSTSVSATAIRHNNKSPLPSLLPTPTTPPLKNGAIKKISPVESETIFDVSAGDSNTNSESGIDSPPHLSLNALKGGPSVGTIWFIAHINTLPVTALVDDGSLDNFLQPRVANFLKLPMEPTPLFKVMVGNDNYMTVEGMILDLNIQAQGIKFQLPVILLPISGADLILGANWLKPLGSHIADYDSLQLKFLHNGRFITLQGEKDHSPTQAQLHHLKIMVFTHSIAEAFSMQLLESPDLQSSLDELTAELALDLALLLHKYLSVFETPSSLPPPRSHDHVIPLIDGSKPVKVKPYRYLHSQKDEIERPVHGMLEDEPSKSPFPSPIILVKKKDGSWRVCTDYRALNVVTVKDTFPIPTVDELIDELFGA
ncbi:uncharacterized protein LOC124837990 [Vigna umbellata]|uniref:uncharacterized protein LOC124837990 n=1 Tax=Vigna umbellata TaxID=87088 RepID=UPI001F5FEDC2|nr:uncharacterized protein LOC124837990 [Vigna umbellata]